MPSMHDAQTKCHAGAIEQEFLIPPRLPHVEIRITHDSAHPYALHAHRALSVGLILKGRVEFFCDGARHMAEAGDIVLIEPGAAHRCNAVGDVARSYYMLHVEADWCLAQLGGAAALRLRQRTVRDPESAQDLRNAVQALQQGEAGAEDRLDACLARLLRAWCVAAEEESPAGWLEAARRLLSLQPEKALRVADIARKTGLCREAFIRAFRRKTGLSPGAYRHCLRLERGRRLLRLGQSIAEAAVAAGYADQSHFHRTFVKYFSATPRQYRRGRSLSFKK